ncbi:MAG: MiaB-like tRNA modifying enzyme [Pseudomonadota bacterium]|jgi:ribosomal protein S12 methylthiotransferase
MNIKNNSSLETTKNNSSPPSVGFISLGCPKAQVDSEHIITQLKAQGYDISPTYENADLVVVNTCGFIEDAVDESLDAINEALNNHGKVIVTGCLGAKKDEDGQTIVQKKHPNVLAVTGPHAINEVMQEVNKHLPRPHDPFMDLVPKQGIRLTPKHYAYLKISEGCNHRCSFCIIPSLRGDLVSRSIDDILQEAEHLLKAGTKELLVISQDTSAYGVDIKFRTGFWQGKPIKSNMYGLCKALGELAKSYGAWVRLHYVYPYPHVDEIIPLMAEGLILPYLDIPMQHAHPDVLKRMKRPANGEKNLERIQKWREICPEIVIRSTFIAGFPGETDEEFEYLLNFIKEAKLDRVGCFAYSDIEGAKANDLENQIPKEIREARQAKFMEVATQVSEEKLKSKVGKQIQVLVDDFDEESGYARSQADAPEIDGVVYLPPPQDCNTPYTKGSMIMVEVEDSSEHDLWACPV